jgi:DNA-binding XRE family transcriptional regulator
MTLSNYGKLNEHSTIKNKFKDYFKDTDISQREFAKMIGIHQSSLSSFLNNQKQPSLETFIKIWIGLGCPPISDLLTSE